MPVMGARLVRAAASSAILLTASAAGAQTLGDIALTQLEPSVAGDAFFGVPSPFIGGHLKARAAVLLDHADHPLTLSTSTTSSALVASQTWLHVGASLALWDRLLLGLVLPVVVAQGGESPRVQEVTIPSPDGAALGDLRFSIRIRMFGEDADPFQVSAGTLLHFPTGAAGVFAGEGAVRDTPQLTLGGRYRMLVWSASAGMLIRGSENPSAITYGGGVAALVWEDRIQIGPEIFASTPVQEVRPRVQEVRALELDDTTNLEVLLGARGHLPLGFMVGGGAGVGLTDAVGTPAYRVVGFLGWGPAPPKRAPEKRADDADEDGVTGGADACPYAFGPASADAKRSGCPVIDSDEDGVQDFEDACPEVSGDAAPGDAAPGAKGCPEAAPAAGSAPN
jgi:hypothetical protein